MTRPKNLIRIARQHPRLFILALLVATVFAVFAGCQTWRLWASRGYRVAEGIYLADGGQSFIRIRARSLGRLELADGHIAASLYEGLPEVTADIRFSRGCLFLVQKEEFAEEILSVMGVLDLRLQPTADGDWDLAQGAHIVTVRCSLADFARTLAKDIRHWNFQSTIDLAQGFVTCVIQREAPLQFSLPEGAPPLPAFLHRVDDPRIPEYFALRREWTDPHKCLQLIREICRSHPDDPFLMLHLAELEAENGNAEESLRVYNRWKQLHSATPNPLLQIVARRAWKATQRVHFSRDYPAFPHYADLFAKDIDTPPAALPRSYDRSLNSVLRYFRDRSRIDQIHFAPDPIVMPSECIRQGMKFPEPDFSAIWKVAKCAGGVSSLRLLAGKRTEALELALGMCALAQDMNSHATSSDLLHHRVGILINHLGTRQLAQYGLNAIETEQEMRSFLEQIEQMALTPPQTKPENSLLGNRSPLQLQMSHWSGWAMPDYSKTFRLHRVSDSWMAILRGAARAKLEFIQHGAFPASREALAALCGDSPIPDPFDDTLTVGCAATSEGCVIYTVGPDGIDQKGAFPYAPTSRGIGKGDILLEVPRERQYPFPRDGLQASSARNVLQAFPQGLPPDPCNGTREAALGILDATSTHPVVIFSKGPGMEEETPETDPGIWPFSIPPRQPVYVRAFQEPPPRGAYFLEPPYDPTNGTYSSGDLYIEIPPR